MTFYLLYYISIGAILTIGYLLKNKFFTYIALSVIIFISGFRYEVGYDFLNYVSLFKGHLETTPEPLFMLILHSLRNIWDNAQILFFSFSFATIIITFISIKKISNFKRMGIMIYLLIPGLYLNSFSIIRQAIAISLFFLAIYYLYENKKIKYWMIGVTAIFIHFSAIIPFLFIFLLKRWFSKKYNFYSYFIFLLVAFIIAYFNLPILFIGLFGKFSVYAELLTIDTPITKVLVMFLIAIVIILGLKNKNDKKNNLLLNIFIIGVFINIAFAQFPPVTRMGYYFVITQAILVPTIIFSLKYNTLKFVAVIVFFTYYFGIQIKALEVDEKQPEAIKMTPYKNYLLQ
ncbi:MAG: EpsG family protein [Capnocytophaga sp.]|nr:EpsG family protein [Capnocytophaga sp.]